MSRLRRYVGAIKDTTSVSFARVNSDYKALDIAIVRATSHVHCPPKEAHIRAIFTAISATRPRADVVYCIHALARRLSKTHNWVVALKTLMVIHRALREVDKTFREALINHGRRRGRILNMAHFRDDSSAETWFYSAWVRAYALFLEERLECFRPLKYDVHFQLNLLANSNTRVLLQHLPPLQQLLFRALNCQPEGASIQNQLIHLALSMVASESFKIYQGIGEGLVRLVDEFFSMQQREAVQTLAICRRAANQAERFTQFYEVCKHMTRIEPGDRFFKMEEIFLQAMEDYVKEAPGDFTPQKKEVGVLAKEVDGPKKVVVEAEKKRPSSFSPSSTIADSPQTPMAETECPSDEALQSSYLDELDRIASELKEKKNASDLGAVSLRAVIEADGTTTSSNKSVTSTTTPVGGLDKITLDSLHTDATRINNWNESFNPFCETFLASPPSVPIAAKANQKLVLVWPQLHQVTVGHLQQPSMNPFGNLFEGPCDPTIEEDASGVPTQACDLHPSLI